MHHPHHLIIEHLQPSAITTDTVVLIAEHPEAIGIANVKQVAVEHVFCCGDTVDILFERNDGTDIVVEIETIDPEPGCHQAIKYRALRCAERGIPLDSKQIKTINTLHWSRSGERRKAG